MTSNILNILIDYKLLLGLLKGEKESDTLMKALSKNSSVRGHVTSYAHSNFIVNLSVLKGQKLSERSSLELIKVVKISDIHFEYASELNLNAESALDLALAIDYNMDVIVTSSLEDFKEITQLPILTVNDFIIRLELERLAEWSESTTDLIRNRLENKFRILEKERVTNNLQNLELELMAINEKYSQYSREIIRRLTKLYYLDHLVTRIKVVLYPSNYKYRKELEVFSQRSHSDKDFSSRENIEEEEFAPDVDTSSLKTLKQQPPEHAIESLRALEEICSQLIKACDNKIQRTEKQLDRLQEVLRWRKGFQKAFLLGRE